MSVHDTGLAFHNIAISDGSSPAIPRPVGAGAAVLSPKVAPSSHESPVESERKPAFQLRNKPGPDLGVADVKPLSKIGSVPAAEMPKAYPEMMCVKGAPDVLLAKCSHYMLTAQGNKGHKMMPVDKAFISSVTAAFEQMAAQGERALAYAIKWLPQRTVDEESHDPAYRQRLKESLVGQSKLSAERGLCFVGLLSLVDPPRPEVQSAIATCAGSGIQVVMVTGDYPTTAQAIARKIGLMTFPTKSEIAMQRGVSEAEVSEAEVRAVTIHGSQLDALSDSDWRQLVKKVRIFI
jgi:magnesium-transporting ATPase (P-type)